jgi:hypothetical protein
VASDFTEICLLKLIYISKINRLLWLFSVKFGTESDCVLNRKVKDGLFKRLPRFIKDLVYL